MFVIQSPGEIAFSILGFSVYWYGIIMAFAVFAGVCCANFLAKGAGFPNNFFVDHSPVIILTGLLGARLYYCLLNFNHYVSAPFEILDIRQGGLSVHGMIFAGIFCIYYLALRYKFSFLKMTDILACSAVIAQSIGRWGNFFNSEAFGLPTNLNFGVYIEPFYRPLEYLGYEVFHPTFLYESVADFIIFVCLIFLFKSKIYKPGKVFFVYLGLYSLVRFFIESLRIDSALNIQGIPIAQIVSAVLFLVCICGLFFVNKKSN